MFVIILPEGARIEADAATVLDHGFTSDVTEWPVEDGFPMADGARRRARDLRVQAVFSDTSTKDPRTSSGRSQKIYFALRDAWNRGAAVTVATDREIYADVLITDVRAPDGTRRAGAIEMSMTFRQIRKVKARFLAVRLKARTKAVRHKSGKNAKGATAGSPSPGVTKDTIAAILKKRVEIMGSVPQRYTQGADLPRWAGYDRGPVYAPRYEYDWGPAAVNW